MMEILLYISGNSVTIVGYAVTAVVVLAGFAVLANIFDHKNNKYD